MLIVYQDLVIKKENQRQLSSCPANIVALISREATPELSSEIDTRVGFIWFNVFEGRQNVHDDERSGSPVTATDNAAVAAIRNVVEADRRVTIDEIIIRLSPGIEIRRSSIGTIMSDVLNSLKVCARWVPRLLLENHKQQRMEAARAFLEMHQRDGDQLFSRIVTGDESWVHHSTPETKRQSMVWKKPEESAPKRRRSQSLQAKLWLWKTSNGKFSHIHLILRNLPQATSIFIHHSSGTLEASTLRMMTKCRRRRTTCYEDRTLLGTTVVSKNCYNGTKNVWTEMVII
ncbi:hypothetical protein LAZ67_15001238 [Cordylochernes scorpioides]|uniref:Histone-lysine N-methyltransferase SETMAR n=1 Tax=Cordylochernes scorpioides TaxID=51811 RepID=A0ABY6L8K5_9ARAC|nr:hypothetical protein LAZ67_15001238 [Cordylochernes scorpioides]